MRVLPGLLLAAAALTSCGDTEPRAARSLVRLFEGAEWVSVGAAGRQRRAFAVPAGSRVEETIELPEEARLDWSVAARSPGRRPIEARVLLVHAGGETELASRTLSPGRRGPGHWHDGRVDLSRWGGREVKLAFESRQPGGKAGGSGAPGSVYWASPRVTGKVSRGRRPTSVLLVLVDTLRADRLGCYGGRRAATPAIDRLAQRGTLFESAFSQANWTLPSVATLFSGLYPSAHGVREERKRLASDPSHLAPLMLRNGYLTVGFHAGGYLSERFGFAEGFDLYRVWKGFSEIGRAAAWLERYGDAPFFLFLHTYDVHAPYGSVPEAFWRTHLGGTRVDPDLVRSKPAQLFRQGGGSEPSENDLEVLSKLYDGEVGFVDAQLGRLLEEIERMGLDDDLLVVLTSDHGEEFGEHGQLEHGTRNLYDEVARVPLILTGPGVAAGRRVDEPVQVADLLPTLAALLDLAGVEPDRLDGVSLAGLLAAGAAGAPANPRRALTEGRGSRALRSLEWTLIEDPRREPQLFDRRADPGERDDLALSRPDVVESQRASLSSLLGGPRETRSEDSEIDERLRRELRALGYLD
jgi:arylsulfatase A-like enzyme